MIRDYLRIPYREDSLFGIVLLSLFVVPLFFLPVIDELYETPRFAVAMVLVGLGLTILAFKNLGKFRMSKLMSVSLLVFLVLNVISTLAGVDIYNGIFGIYGRFATSLTFVFLWTALVFMIGFENSEQKTLSLFRVFVLSGFLVSVLGIMHIYGYGFYSGLDNDQRQIIPSFIGNQNFSAMFLVGIIPLSLPLIVNSKNLLRKVIYAVMAVVSIWAVMIFASRGAILAFAVSIIIGLIAIFFKKVGGSVKFLVLGFAIAGLLFAYFFYSATRFEETSGSLDLKTNVSTQTRLIVWSESASLLKNRELTGLGPGNFYIGFRGLGNNTLPGSSRFDDAHNIFIHTAVSTGVPSMLVLMFIFFLTFYSAAKLFVKENSLIGWSISVGLIGVLVSACFSPVNISVWFLLAFLIGASQFRSLPQVISVKSLPYKAKTIIFTLGVILMVIGVIYMTSEILSDHSKKAYRAENLDKSLRYGSLAKELNPLNSIGRIYAVASMIKQDKDPEEIRNQIDILAKVHKNSSGTQKYASDLYFMLYKKTNNENDLKSSLDHLKLVEQLEPNYGPVLVNSAYLYYKAGDIESAESSLRRAISLRTQGDFYFGWLLLAEIYLEKGQLDLMNKALSEANLIAPSPALENLLRLYSSGNFTFEKLPVTLPDIDV